MLMPRGSILQIESNGTYHKVTEHNRSAFDISPQRIETQTRMVNGSLRKFWIADKRAFSLSWDMLPHSTDLTVDGQWGAEDIQNFYYSSEGRGAFNIKINLATDGTNQESTGEIVKVMFQSASFSVLKRGLEPFWSVSITLDEV
jgi:hypothetical protein